MSSNDGDTAQNQENTSTNKLPMTLMMPELNEDHTMRIFKHLANIKKPQKPKSDNETKSKQKRYTIYISLEVQTLIL